MFLLANVQEEYSSKGLEYLQKKLLQLNPKAASDMNGNRVDWVDRVKRYLRMKSVLIVLDDVGERSHITELVGDCSSFGSRSRIIITTRDERVLLMNVASTSNEGGITRMEVKGMNPEQAMQLFSRHAFGSDSPPEDYMSLSEDVVSISSGLPLALEVIGSLLYGLSIEAWTDKIAELKTIPEGRVQKKLMMSYDALEYHTKEVFLDIACFFINVEKSNPIYMWEACGFGPNWAVDVLLAMSLMKITDDGKFCMNDQLRDLGREIVRIKGGYNGPSSREGSRIQTYEDALYALERTKEKEVVGLRLVGSGDTPTDFSSYANLRFLQAQRSAIAIGNFWKLPQNLRWLSLSLDNPNLIAATRSMFSWFIQNCRSCSYLMKLVVLDLSYSINISDYWEGWILIQELRGLKVLDLTHCQKLTRTPNFSKMIALEKLVLRGCESLVKIDSSIGKLRKLKYLNLEGCYRLRELPEEVGNLKDVEHIIITTSIYLSSLPDSIRELKNLKHLSLIKCYVLKKLPDSIGDLRSLVHLDISWSRKWEELPVSIGRLEKLEHLSLSRCECLNKLPDSIGGLTSLVSLDLSHCRLIEELPISITRLVKLRKLSLHGCNKLVKLPDEFGNLESLVELDLSYTGVAVVPDSVGDLASLQVINLSYTKVSVLPETIAQLSLVKSLDLSECPCVERVPNKLPPTLTHLKLKFSSQRQALVDLSELLQLRSLMLDDVSLQHLSQSPFRFDAIRTLSRLVDLHVRSDSITSLDQLCALTELKSLRLRCPNLKCVPQFPSSLQRLTLEGIGGETELPCLPNLSELKFEDCWIEGGIFRSLGVERLELLTILNVKKCGGIDIFPDISKLKSLELLDIEDCNELVEIPGLGKLVSLDVLFITGCGSLESIKNLKRLKAIRVKDCKSFRGIQGLEELSPVDVTFRIEGCKCKDSGSDIISMLRIPDPALWLYELSKSYGHLKLRVIRLVAKNKIID